jgi:hypothetical protein
LKPLGYSVLAGMIIWCIPAPAGVTAQAWHLLAVFVGTIVGIITNVRHPPRTTIENSVVELIRIGDNQSSTLNFFTDARLPVPPVPPLHSLFPSAPRL